MRTIELRELTLVVLEHLLDLRDKSQRCILDPGLQLIRMFKKGCDYSWQLLLYFVADESKHENIVG